jgi:hypothetical protein
VDELSAMGPTEHLDELRVEAFLKPLEEVAPASRANGRRRARARAMRLVVIVAVLVGLGAGIALAAEQDESTVTIVDTGGDVTTEPVIPVPPPADCADPTCSTTDGDQGRADQQAHPKEAGRHP